MKKYISILLTMFLIPTLVNAETLTYDVCESGCEYTNLGDVGFAINNISDLSDKDIIININSDLSAGYIDPIGTSNNKIKSLKISGNGYTTNSILRTFSDSVTINNLTLGKEIDIFNAQKIIINNSNIKALWIAYGDSNYQPNTEEKQLKDILEIDKTSLNNLSVLAFLGNIKIENMNLSKQVLFINGGTIDIYNSEIKMVTSVPSYGSIITNIYNSKFNSLKYTNITSTDSTEWNEITQFMSSMDSSKLNYDIYDIGTTNMGGQAKSITTIYFDKETKLKPSEKLNLVNYLDYYTEDKEIEYTIEDESIAKIENKELMGLKEGSTKVTVTTDEGHVVYRINLVVEKETIPEKIDKMTIKVPITGSKIKAWVLIVGGILLGIVGICSYMLIKRKK